MKVNRSSGVRTISHPATLSESSASIGLSFCLALRPAVEYRAGTICWFLSAKTGNSVSVHRPALGKDDNRCKPQPATKVPNTSLKATSLPLGRDHL